MSHFSPSWNLTTSLENRWVDERPASTTNQVLAGRKYSLSEYSDSTLTFTKSKITYNKKGKFRFQIHNLFVNKYANPGFNGIDFPSLGRSYTFTYQQRF